jgi:hypothetical protein
MNPPAAIKSSRHTPSTTAKLLGKLRRWNAITMPQYKGTATSREPSTFQNNIPVSWPLLSWPNNHSGCYATFCKENVKVTQDGRDELFLIAANLIGYQWVGRA